MKPSVVVCFRLGGLVVQRVGRRRRGTSRSGLRFGEGKGSIRCCLRWREWGFDIDFGTLTIVTGIEAFFAGLSDMVTDDVSTA